ncbi:hypothetical protein E4U41_003862 [Claviceps citrina]|nr:hypothetical protein E4U41_003862 [Claviceps citrina]
MRPSILCLCLAAQALAHDAAPAVKRDLPTIMSVLANVQASIERLKLALDTGFRDPGPLLLASNGLITSLKTGAIQVNGTGSIDFLDAVRLIRPVNDLKALVESLTSNLKGTRGDIKKAGLCDVTRLQMTSISTRCQDLIHAVNGKLPEEAQEISVELTSGLTTVLAQSEDEFSEQNCRMAGDGAAEVSAGVSVSVSRRPSSIVAAAFLLAALSFAM